MVIKKQREDTKNSFWLIQDIFWRSKKSKNSEYARNWYQKMSEDKQKVKEYGK